MILNKYWKDIRYNIQGFVALLHPSTEDFKCEALCVFLFFPSINFFLNHILQTYFSFGSISTYIYLLMGILGLFSYIYYFRKTQSRVVLLITSLFIFTLFSYIIYPEISDIFFSGELNPLTSSFLFSFFYLAPVLILTSNICNWDYLLQRAELYSMITVIIGIIDCYFFTIQALSEDIPNYMVYSYNLMTGLGPLVVFTIVNKGVIKFIMLAIGTLCLLLVGARGAQVSFILVVLCTLVIFANNKLRVLFNLSIIGILIILFLLNIEYFSDIIDYYLGDFGVHSRTITKLIEGDFFSESGRDVLRADILKGLRNNPFGYGLYGDRYISATGTWGSAAYCHNIFLEFCCHFGIIIGPLLSLIILYNILLGIFGKITNKGIFLLILLPCGFFKLFFSDSYLLCIPFFAIIGTLLNRK